MEGRHWRDWTASNGGEGDMKCEITLFQLVVDGSLF